MAGRKGRGGAHVDPRLREALAKLVSLDDLAAHIARMLRSKDARTHTRGVEMAFRILSGDGMSLDAAQKGVRLNLRSVLSGGRDAETVDPPAQRRRKRRTG